MSESCPTLEVLRAFAEDPSSEAALEPHVLSCARCQRLVALARREEAAIRQALPADVPRGLLEKTLAAIDASTKKTPSETTPSRRRASASRPPRSSGAGWIVLAGVVLAGVAVVALLGRGSDHGENTGESPILASPLTPPSTPAPKASARPTSTPSSASSIAPSPEGVEPSPEATPVEIVPGPSPATPPTDPHPGLTPGAPQTPGISPSPTNAPGEIVASRGKTLARVRSGKLAAKGHTYAAGESLPEGESLEASGAASEVDGEGSVALVLAAHAKVTIRAGSSGETVFALAAGSRLLARTTGTTKWALETPDTRVTPLGTELVVAVEAKLTRVSLLEGRARLDVEKSVPVEVRSGFELEVTRGRPPELPRPFAPARAVSFLPEALRPKTLPKAQRLVRAHTFDDGLDGATKGEAVAGGARGSRGCVRAVKLGADYAVVVEMDNTHLALDPNLWVEATVKVSQKTKVVLQVWDSDTQENHAYFATVEPGAWTTIAAPMRAFGDANGRSGGPVVKAGEKSTCFSVFAGDPGESVELLVDDVRFSLEE